MNRPAEWRELLGRKISIRYRLRDDPKHPHSEAIGVVAGVEQSERGSSISVMTRRGTTVSVATDDIVAMKEFPSP